MTRFVAFLGRKSQAGKSPEQPTDGSAAPNDLELDNELFMPLATQLGEETEAIRILLVDAEHKIGELENVKRSIGGLVEPVNKTLRAYEQIKNEKLGLQGVLNATRVAYNKLREDMSTVEKRAATLETECNRLRELSTVVQQAAAALQAAGIPFVVTGMLLWRGAKALRKRSTTE